MSELRGFVLLAVLSLSGLAACGGEHSDAPPNSEAVPTQVAEPSAPPLAAVAKQSEQAPAAQVATHAPPGQAPVTDAAPLLTIVYTHNIDGEIEPCG